MTSAEFYARFPKPWRFVIRKVSLTLRAANGDVLAHLDINRRVHGIAGNELKRHLAGALSEWLPCIEDQDDTDARRAKIERVFNECQSAARLPGAEPPPAEQTVSATQSPEPKKSAQGSRAG